MITENVHTLLEELKTRNPYGEEVTLVAATKTRTAAEINEAIAAGITDIGENRVQEFIEKFDKVHGAKRHFIGHLQTNKIKFLVGKTDLIHSLDRIDLADELQKRARNAGWIANCLIEINLGNELSKSGFSLEQAEDIHARLAEYSNLGIRGFMAMLPISEDNGYLRELCLSMREIYDTIRASDRNISVPSMGMSNDYKLCIACGSNMIRLGRHIFGTRRDTNGST